MFDEPVPEMLKSIVVLDITIDREGRLARVDWCAAPTAIKALENARARQRAPRRAVCAAAAGWRGAADGSVSFLETFLFRDDGRYRIRSLVAAR